jgi:ribonucleoside-diphosphate reductase beta chain
LPWIDELIAAGEHVNFFENRVTEYAKAATRGNWIEAFEALDNYVSRK